MSKTSHLKIINGVPVTLEVWDAGFAFSTNKETWLSSFEGTEPVALQTTQGDLICSFATQQGHPWLYGVGTKNLYRWERESGELKEKKKNSEGFGAVSLHKDGNWLAWSSNTGVAVSKAETLSVFAKKEFSAYSDEAGCKVEWRPETEPIACINAQAILTYAWDGKKMKRVEKRGFGRGSYWGMFWDLAVSPDGQWMAALTDPCGGRDGNRLYLWDMKNDRLKKRFDFPDNFENEYFARSCCFTTSGSHLAFDYGKKELDWISFFKTETATLDTPELSFYGDYGPELMCMTFHPNGRWLVGLAETTLSIKHSRVLIWDLESGQLL